MKLSENEHIIDVDAKPSNPYGQPSYDVVVLSGKAIYRYTYNSESNLILVEYYPYDFGFDVEKGTISKTNNLIMAYISDNDKENKLISYIPGRNNERTW